GQPRATHKASLPSVTCAKPVPPEMHLPTFSIRIQPPLPLVILRVAPAPSPASNRTARRQDTVNAIKLSSLTSRMTSSYRLDLRSTLDCGLVCSGPSTNRTTRHTTGNSQHLARQPPARFKLPQTRASST